MAAKLGTGSEAYAPLALAIIGGQTISFLLTIFIVPAAYLLVKRRGTRSDENTGLVELSSSLT
jgi:multidrug efflux pump subunit AcrB